MLSVIISNNKMTSPLSVTHFPPGGLLLQLSLQFGHGGLVPFTLLLQLALKESQALLKVLLLRGEPLLLSLQSLQLLVGLTAKTISIVVTLPVGT